MTYLFGAYAYNSPWDHNEGILEFERKLGRPLDIIHFYVKYDIGADGLTTLLVRASTSELDRAQRRRLLVSIQLGDSVPSAIDLQKAGLELLPVLDFIGAYVSFSPEPNIGKPFSIEGRPPWDTDVQIAYKRAAYAFYSGYGKYPHPRSITVLNELSMDHNTFGMVPLTARYGFDSYSWRGKETPARMLRSVRAARQAKIGADLAALRLGADGTVPIEYDHRPWLTETAMAPMSPKDEAQAYGKLMTFASRHLGAIILFQENKEHDWRIQHDSTFAVIRKHLDIRDAAIKNALGAGR